MSADNSPFINFDTAEVLARVNEILTPPIINFDTTEVLARVNEILTPPKPIKPNPFSLQPLTDKVRSLGDNLFSTVVATSWGISLLAGRVLIAPADYAHTLQNKGFRENADAVRSEAVIIPIAVAIDSFFNGGSAGEVLRNVILFYGAQGAAAMALETIFMENYIPPEDLSSS